MKTLLTVLALGLICVALLFVIQKSRPITASVLSCETEGAEAVVSVEYRNRLARPVTITYDLSLTKDRPETSSGGKGIGLVLTRHFAAVVVPARDAKIEIVRMVLPPNVGATNAIITNLAYE